MTDEYTELEQLMAVALSEMKEAQRYAATQTAEGMQISLRHISNADFYMKKINEL